MENLKLFTRGDLDRCARLTLLNYVNDPDPEHAISAAVRDIAAEAPAYYDEETVKRILLHALPGATEDIAGRALEDALEYFRK